MILFHVAHAAQSGMGDVETLLMAGLLGVGSVLVALSASARRRRRAVRVEATWAPSRIEVRQNR